MSIVSFSIALYILISSIAKYLQSLMVIQQALTTFKNNREKRFNETQLDIGLKDLHFYNKFKALYEISLTKNIPRANACPKERQTIATHLFSTSVMNTYWNM